MRKIAALKNDFAGFTLNPAERVVPFDDAVRSL
jgi:hypothetical protein